MRVVLLGQAIIHEPVDWSDEIRALTAGADAVICNFEGCLPPPDAWPMKTGTVHPQHDQALDMLMDLGVTHLGLANNHAWDFGHVGMLSTRSRATDAGFAVAGTGPDADEAWSPAVHNGVALVSLDAGPTPDWAIAGPGPGLAALELKPTIRLPRADIERLIALSEATGDAQRRRLRQAVGFDAPDPTPRPFGLELEEAHRESEAFRIPDDRMEHACRCIRRALFDADQVVVAIHYHHWSPDWLAPPAWFGDIAAGFVDAGATAVVGTGPPWAFETARRGDSLVAPGLGNLVFHTRRADLYDRMNLPVWDGLAAVAENGVWTTVSVRVQRPSPSAEK